MSALLQKGPGKTPRSRAARCERVADGMRYPNGGSGRTNASGETIVVNLRASDEDIAKVDVSFRQ